MKTLDVKFNHSTGEWNIGFNIQQIRRFACFCADMVGADKICFSEEHEDGGHSGYVIDLSDIYSEYDDLKDEKIEDNNSVD